KSSGARKFVSGAARRKTVEHASTKHGMSGLFQRAATGGFMFNPAVVLLGVAIIFSPFSIAHGQAYPKQAINLIVPLAPGGATVGTDSAVKAARDGYTILITNNAALIYNRILTPEAVPYDPFKDLIAL